MTVQHVHYMMLKSLTLLGGPLSQNLNNGLTKFFNILTKEEDIFHLVMSIIRKKNSEFPSRI